MARADELTATRPGDLLRLPWWCLAGAVLVHLALLASGAQALGDWKRSQALPKPSDTPSALKVRYVAAPAVAPAAVAAALPRPLARWGLAAAPVPPVLAPEPVLLPEVPVIEPAVYVPRALLTEAPAVRAPVLLQWPPNWLIQQSYTAILKLYLDEQGRVERVEPDGDAALPGPLLETAREAFLAADFTPGQLNGRAVKSWMRIEVTFESGGVAAPP